MNRKYNISEYVAAAIFSVTFIIVSIYHEPWYDEAQAWEIAKCASIKEILLYLPHYEGHPPLWHLILCIPAKLGAPYEISIKIISAIPTFFTVWYILFRLKLPRIVRLLLPFNYFIFYQYGVISRPYCLIFPIMLLLADIFPEKDEHPWKFTGLLALLCLVSAYGIIIAGGIALAWVWDILEQTIKKYGNKSVPHFIRDARLWALVSLLFVALLLIAQILPNDETEATSATVETTASWLLLCFTGLLPDALITSAITCIQTLSDDALDLAQLIPVCIAGILIIAAGIAIIPKGKKKYFIFPYVLFCGFSSFVYISTHHIGILAAIVLFEYIICCNVKVNDIKISISNSVRTINTQAVADMENNEHNGLQSAYELNNSLIFKYNGLSDKDKKLLSALLKYSTLLFLIIPAVWTVTASVADIMYPYYFSRSTAEFLKETGLCDTTIVCQSMTELNGISEEEYRELGIDRDNDMNSSETDDYRILNNIYLPFYSSSLNAYFDKNIIANLNDGDENCGYTLCITPTLEENLEKLTELKAMGYPDVIIGSDDYLSIFDGSDDIPEYSAVYCMHSNHVSIWKFYFYGEKNFNYSYIYVRNDLLEKYNLEAIEAID